MENSFAFMRKVLQIIKKNALKRLFAIIYSKLFKFDSSLSIKELKNSASIYFTLNSG